MSLKYRIVLKKDMSKGAAQKAQLYYGQIRSIDKISYKKLCELVAGYGSAKKGEVSLVIDGLLFVLKEQLESGNVVQMGDWGGQPRIKPIGIAGYCLMVAGGIGCLCKLFAA